MGSSGEEGNGSAREGLRKMLVLVPDRAVLRFLWWPEMEDRQPMQTLAQPSHTTWGSDGYCQGLPMFSVETNILAVTSFTSFGPHSNHNTPCTDKETEDHGVNVTSSALDSWSMAELDYKPNAWDVFFPRACRLGRLRSLLLSVWSQFPVSTEFFH